MSFVSFPLVLYPVFATRVVLNLREGAKKSLNDNLHTMDATGLSGIDLDTLETCYFRDPESEHWQA